MNKAERINYVETWDRYRCPKCQASNYINANTTETTETADGDRLVFTQAIFCWQCWGVFPIVPEPKLLEGLTLGDHAESGLALPPPTEEVSCSRCGGGIGRVERAWLKDGKIYCRSCGKIVRDREKKQEEQERLMTFAKEVIVPMVKADKVEPDAAKEEE